MERNSQGEESAEPPSFVEFAAARGSHLIRTAYLLTGGDAFLAEDLTQEALGRMYGRWRKIRRIENLAGYAQTVLVNTFLSHRRKRSSTEQATDRFTEFAVHDPDHSSGSLSWIPPASAGGGNETPAERGKGGDSPSRRTAVP